MGKDGRGRTTEYAEHTEAKNEAEYVPRDATVDRGRARDLSPTPDLSVGSTPFVVAP